MELDEGKKQYVVKLLQGSLCSLELAYACLQLIIYYYYFLSVQ